MASHAHRADSATASASSSGSVIAAMASSTAAKAASSAPGGGGKATPQHPEDVWYGLISLLALATIVNACYISWVTYRRFQARRGSSQGDSTTPPPGGNGRLSLRRIPHAILSASRIVGFRWRIPGLELMMAEVLFTIAYMGACLVWCFAPVDGVTYPTNLTGKSWGTKLGQMTALQLSFIVLLSTKNNPITLLTGIGHEKLNLMHRVVSRCIFVLAWLHMGGMYVRSPPKLINAGYKVAGAVAISALTITTLVSFKSFRRRFYELFYASHIVLVLILLIGVHVHLQHQQLEHFIWPAWAIWLFDRVLRGARHLLLNIVLRPSDSKARIEALGADGLRITLRRRVPGGWTAGQHAFLAFPTLGLESHPFTIASVHDPRARGEEELVFTVRAMQGQTRRLADRAVREGTGFCELPVMLDGPYGHPQDIRAFSTCVFVAGGTGVTYTLGRMHQLLSDVNASDACAQRVVFVWAVRTQTQYEWVAADLAKTLASAPPSVSLAVDIYLTNGSASADPDADPEPALRSLPTLPKSFNSNPNPDAAADPEKRASQSSSSEDEKRSSSGGACTPSLKKPEEAYFATTSGTTTPTMTMECALGDGALSLSLSGSRAPCAVRMRAGRPDVYRILEEEISAAAGAVAVDVSGPDALVHDVRRALCAPFAGPRAVLRGAPTVVLSVEQFRM